MCFRPKGPSEVVLTGTFDNWSGSLPLVKTSSGDFEITLPLKQEDDDKVLFKFIVDGNWTTSKDYETFNDAGNENNVLYLKNLSQVSENKSSKIPEAGGLAVGAGGVAALASTTKDHDKENVKPTVLPSNEGNHASLAGEPGVAIPSNPHEIKEFSEVRDVDAKDLNAKLNKEEEEQTFETQVLPSEEGKQTTLKGEPGVAIPNDPQEVKEFSEVRDVDAKELNEKLGGAAESTTSSEKKTKKVAVKKLIRRNKKTGEEVVVSSEPVENVPKDAEKTLDPKKSSTTGGATDETKDTKDEDVKTNGATEAVTSPSKVTEKTPKTTTATTSSKPKPKPKPAAGATTDAKEEKKKSSVFRKFKKFFD